MATKIAPAGYSFAQVSLHWLIAALVIIQLIIGEDIVPAYRAHRRGTEVTPDDLWNANIHVYLGIAVFALAILRLAIRLNRGVPPPPSGESSLQHWAAAAVHLVLYAAIFLMPVTGAAAWYLGIGWLGEVHEFGKPVIIIAVLLHAAAALWQHFVQKSDVLVRMLKPNARS
ncbi:MAG: cytochrome b/b6 domain-containing protein [Hyphomicrobiales bacterium]